MKTCRVCRTELPHPFLNLGNSPISNAYLTEMEIHHPEIYYPLEVYYCPKCHLVQIDEFAKPEMIFSEEYIYLSSYSSSWLAQCKEYTDMMIKRFGIGKHSSVIEIGSNDGYLLQYFKERGIPVLGVDPATTAAKLAWGKGVPTDTVFFNTEYVTTHNRKADLLIGNNVLAHNPDLNGFVEGMGITLNPHGIITIEVPHLLSLLNDNQFDTIYHEHYSYFSLHAVRFLFRQHGLEIFDVEELPTHGGSLRVYVKHEGDHSKEVSKNISQLLYREQVAGLLTAERYKSFGDQVEKTKRNLLEGLITIRNEGKTVVGYGAPAKGNTLLNYCGIRTDFLKYTVDANPWKQGRYLPGTHIPIQPPDQIMIDKPDYVLILPWNIKDEIMGQVSYIREWGGKFIVPIPTVWVIDP